MDRIGLLSTQPHTTHAWRMQRMHAPLALKRVTMELVELGTMIIGGRVSLPAAPLGVGWGMVRID